MCLDACLLACWPAGLDVCLLACWPAGLLVSMPACWPAGLDAFLWSAGFGLEFCQSVFSDRFFHFLQRFFFFVG
ncbi:hypothetical protein [Thiolapillus sp.]|uniref:hypothetical protein n=1 Tax=Thiolapillus sp. TaxID=2017437 RepID=UPI003AF56BB2